MQFTVNAFYCNADWDSTVQTCYIKNFDLDTVRTLLSKAKELKNTITNFRELIVSYPAWDADFITSFSDEETESLVRDESNTVPIKVHAKPIDRDLYDYECTRHCDLHVTEDSFYFKSFEKHTGYAMETDWITLEDLTE
jgi:hypothetical protein